MGPSPHHTLQGRATQSFPPERSRGPSQVTQYLLSEVVGSGPEYVLGGVGVVPQRWEAGVLGATPFPLGWGLPSTCPLSPLQAKAICLHPLYVMLPCTLAASLAFMLPVATPPNAIVFSFGGIKVSDMVSGRGPECLSTPFCSVFPSQWATK